MVDLSSLSDAELEAISQGNLNSLSDNALSIIAGESPISSKPEAPLFSTSSMFEGIKNFGSGVVRGGAQLAALGGDILLTPIERGIEYATGTDIPLPYMSTAMDKALEQIGLPREDSLPQRVGEFMTPVGPGGKVAQAVIGAGAGAANYAAEKWFPDNPIMQTVFTVLGGGAAGGAKYAGTRMLEAAVPKLGAKQTARQVAEEVRKVVPNALTESVTPGQRAASGIASLEAKGTAAHEAAGGLFKALPEASVTLDDAITSTTKFVEETSGPLAPGGSTEKILNFMNGLKPKDKTVTTAASTILDEAGKPMIAASSEFIPGGPATTSLTKFQNLLRDLGRAARGADGVNYAVLNKAQSELWSAAENTITDPKALTQLRQAKTAWKEMKAAFEEGAVGAVREGSDDTLNIFKRRLLNDPKSTEQLIKVMTPGEINNAQNLVLSDLFGKSASSWENAITNKIDSFRLLFGEEGASKLLSIMTRDGSVGKKLLQDSNGLRSLITKIAAKPLIGGALGYEYGGGIEGAILGAGLGLGANRSQGMRVARARSIIARAAIGDAEALKILQSPASKLTGKDLVEQVSEVIAKAIANQEQTAGTSNGASSISSGALELPSQKKTLNSDTPMPTDKPVETPENKTLGEGYEELSAKIDADPVDYAIMMAESEGKPRARNPDSTASGLFQLVSKTARALGVKDVFDPEDNYQGYKKLRAENEARFGNDPTLLYSAHYLGAPVLDKWLKGKSLTEAEQAQVRYLKTKALPRFLRIYNSKIKVLKA